MHAGASSLSHLVEVSAHDAADAGLTYINDFTDGFARRREGDGFAYYDHKGVRIEAEEVLVMALAMKIDNDVLMAELTADLRSLRRAMER